MVHVVKCNRCNFSSAMESDFCTIHIFFPQKEELGTNFSIGKKWDERERILTDADLLHASLFDPDNDEETEPIVIHLCPKHTLWFQKLFYQKKRSLKKRA